MTLVAKGVAAWDLWIRGQSRANRMRKKATMRGMSCGRELLCEYLICFWKYHWKSYLVVSPTGLVKSEDLTHESLLLVQRIARGPKEVSMMS